MSQPSPVELALLRVKGARGEAISVGADSHMDSAEVSAVLLVLCGAVEVLLMIQLKNERGL